MNRKNWECPKCQNNEYEMGDVRVAGILLAKNF